MIHLPCQIDSRDEGSGQFQGIGEMKAAFGVARMDYSTMGKKIDGVEGWACQAGL